MDYGWTPEKRGKFLDSLRKTPNVTVAARAAQAPRSSCYLLRENDSEFAKAWDEAIDEGIEMLEAEVHRRAFEGNDKPITHQGIITDTFKEYSDTLAIFLLKAHRPEKYRERIDFKADGLTDLAKAISEARSRGPLV